MYSVNVLFRKDGKLNSAILRNDRISRLYPGLKEWIMNQFPEYDDLRNKILAIKNDGVCKCSVCGKTIKFPNHIASDRLYCSPKCGNNSERKIAATRIATQTEEVKAKRKKTMLERYGYESIFHSPEKQAQGRETLKRNYGVNNPSQSKIIQEKIQKVVKERYGVDSVNRVEKIRAKAVATSLGVSGEFETPEEAKHAYITALGVDCTLKEAAKITIGSYYKPISKELILAKLGRIPITTEMVRKEYTHAYPVLHEYNLMRDRSISTPHQIVLNWLDEFGIEYQTNTRKVIKPKELDIYIPNHKLAIEVNGWYWHDSFRNTPRNYHAEKADDCESVGVQLLQFWDYEIQQKPELIKSIIQSKLGLCKKLHARNLSVKAVPPSMAREFLNICHLNGYTHAKDHLGLFDNGQLVMILSYGRSRFEKDVTEIIRIACAHGMTVVGGVSKLLKHANIHGSIVSYADRRISNGNMYQQLGFRHVYNTNYGYHYFDGQNCHSRQQFQKHKLIKEFGFPESMTEFEMAKTLGLAMLCDAGHMKFIKECKHETS